MFAIVLKTSRFGNTFKLVSRKHTSFSIYVIERIVGSLDATKRALLCKILDETTLAMLQERLLDTFVVNIDKVTC